MRRERTLDQALRQADREMWAEKQRDEGSLQKVQSKEAP